MYASHIFWFFVAVGGIALSVNKLKSPVEVKVIIGCIVALFGLTAADTILSHFTVGHFMSLNGIAIAVGVLWIFRKIGLAFAGWYIVARIAVFLVLLALTWGFVF